MSSEVQLSRNEMLNKKVLRSLLDGKSSEQKLLTLFSLNLSVSGLNDVTKLSAT